MIIEGEQLVSLEIKSSNVIQLSFVAILLRANSITRGWCGDVGDIIMFPLLLNMWSGEHYYLI